MLNVCIKYLFATTSAGVILGEFVGRFLVCDIVMTERDDDDNRDAGIDPIHG